ncbi:MAG: M1 family metallopeptidase [Flavobacteriia bacterium]|nr:M1 family metallopeptidase [Flavobacteriia bacterium]
MKIFTTLSLFIFSNVLFAQTKFAQLDIELPTPNQYRNASGAPGHGYYQQKADYKIKVTIDDKKQQLFGEEVITYTNNSPDVLEFLWLQLDQNINQDDSDAKLIQIEKMEDFKQISDVKRKLFYFDGGFKIDKVENLNGDKMKFYIHKTMMRIDPSKPLLPKQSISFKIKWWYNINDRAKIGGRSGLEYFEEEDNYLYTIAQFFPRMCVYNDVEGWQNKQFLGAGEFTLPFGDYEVAITVPDDHIVGATGILQNGQSVLTNEQKNRLKQAENADKPVFIVNTDEALQSEKSKSSSFKTWVFKAQNVRDFAFASSRKFIWDAQGIQINGKKIMCMSFYPKEGNPLWERYSTKLVAHTIKTYSKYTVDYPYPVAISVHTNRIGMEYPMICFNGGRPQNDGTYSEETKYGMWGVIIHEVGHNFFPMIINSDERQWTWMDEGLNTFVQYLTEQEWERGYPSHRGPAHKITDYMRGDKKTISPIMTNSESIFQFGDNAYGKPATALNILRETIMGRELFDYSFKTYCERWKFKHPTPADFFRTMEEASSVDLDWFWRGWFYSKDYVDISLDEVNYFQLNTNNPEIEKEWLKNNENDKLFISNMRNKNSIQKTVNELDPEIDDFYAKRNKFIADTLDKLQYSEWKQKMKKEELDLLSSNKHYYELKFSNIGGLVSPIIILAIFEDNSEKLIHIPAEIWRKEEEKCSKVFIFDKKVKSFVLDPYLETADCDTDNNSWPIKFNPTRYQLFQQQKDKENPMQRQKKVEQLKTK